MSKQASNGLDVFEAMRLFKTERRLTLPPPAFEDLGGEFVAYADGEAMEMKFLLQKKQENPGGVILGGYFSAFFDMTFGLFSFLETKAWTVSLDLNVCFLKPLMISAKEVLIRAKLVSKTKSNIIIQGEAFKGDDELVATCNSRMLIMKDKS